MKKPFRITPEVQIVEANGKPTRDGLNVLQQLLDKASESTSQIEDWPAYLAFPANKSYTLLPDSGEERTITDVITKSASGTCTVTLYIDGVALGGTANSVSSSEQTQTHTTANVIPVGGRVTATVTSNSSCIDMELQFRTTRTLTA